MYYVEKWRKSAGPNYSIIQEKLQAESCPIHNEQPTIEFYGDKASIDACCDEYAKIVFDRMEKFITKEMDNSLQKAINKRFR